MPKPIIQDVIPPQRKSIRDIPIPGNRKHKETERNGNGSPSPLEPQFGGGWQEPPVSFWGEAFRGFFGKIPRKFLVIGGVVVLVLIVFGGLKFFSVSAHLAIVPKSQEVLVDGSFTAKKEAKAGELQFELMTVSRDAAKTVPSTGEKKVENKASGTIIVYNNYSSQSQRLIKNTRFETPEGLIYRIDRSVTVPGRTTIKGKTTAGSMEAAVYAGAPGEKYNIGLADFTIPGLKGDPRFKDTYARSKTEMTGGFIGTVKVASVQDIAAAQADLDKSLRAQLLSEVSSQKPDGFIFYDNGVYIESQLLSAPEANEVKKRATVYAVIFDKKKLSRFLAERLAPDYDGGEVLGTALESLLFSSEPLSDKPWQKGSLTLALKGRTTLKWSFDEERLKQDLLGQPKDRVPTVLKAYPSIERAEVIIRPFWRSTLPNDASDITISIETATGANR